MSLDNFIEKMLKNYGLSSFFAGVYGLDNQHAHGKIEVGQQLLANEKLKPEDCLIIGDTTHDAEVAKSLDVSCLLISNGHQSEKQLATCGFEIISHLEELLDTPISG